MNKAQQNYCLLQEIEANRRFLLVAYQQNPQLLENAEDRIKEILKAPVCSADNNPPPVFSHRPSQRGISLVELILFIVIISAALAGILLVMNVTGKGSVDPLIHKQALAIAESLLEEIELQDFVGASGVAHAPVTTANRASEYHTVSDYDGYGLTGIYALDGTLIPGLELYNASVAISSAALGDITAPSGNAALITVTVTIPRGETIEISGYRTAHP